MSERRALLDPDMYKISEEDSQDEEVLSGGGLASYAEDVLKLGGGVEGVPISSTEFSSWNNNISRDDWRGGSSSPVGGSKYGHRFSPEGMASAGPVHNRFSGGGGLSSKYKVGSASAVAKLHGNNLAKSKTILLSGTTTSFHVEPEGDNVDWPETSTNSDSYLSSEDRRLNKNERQGYGDPVGGWEGSVVPLANNNKFVSKTYFGDHVRRMSGEGNSFGVDNDLEGNGNHQSHQNSYYHHQHQHHQHHHGHGNRKHLQKRSRRRLSSHSAQSRDSTSGSDYSDESTEEEIPCTQCVGSKSRSGRKLENVSQEESGSSSDVGDYEDESSYSGSSYGDYEDYYDDDEENELFHDMVKYLTDVELESSTNPDGDLFLVEYSAESEVSDGEQISQGQSEHSRDPHHQGDVPHSDESEGHERDETCMQSGKNPVIVEGVPMPTANNFQKEPDKRPVISDTVPHFQKSGKGAKGKISRLLKRSSRDTSSKMGKGAAEHNNPAVGTQTSSQPSSSSIPGGEPSPHPISGSNSHPNQSKSSPSTFTSLSAIKQKGRPTAATSSITASQGGSSASASGNGGGSVPEKVFRFKDEHGGETRTVFVDVPQTARTGNLLGRRATLIESILGILPGRFSTPVPATSADIQQNASNERIMVAGFVPDGVASRYRRIKIGDWLQSVDDISVDHGNVDQVLSSRSMYGKRRTAFDTEYLRLKLTLIRVAGCMVSLPAVENDPSQDSSAKSSPRSSCTEMRWSVVSPHVQSNVAVLFISTIGGGQTADDGGDPGGDNEDGDGEDLSATANTSSSSRSPTKPPEKSKDVVYCWPKESESKLVKALAASQGMFSTLYRLLWDVTGTHPLVSKVVIDDCEMDVTYRSDDQGKSLLLVAVATTLSTFSIHHYQRPRSEGGGGGGGGGGMGQPNSNLSPGSSTADGKKKEKKIRWREPQTGGITVSTRVMARIESLLKYQFGSLSRAFNERNREKVSRLLTNSISALGDLSEDFLFPQVPGNFLRFPDSIRSGIDDVLYSFETSDALCSSIKSPSRRSNDGTGDLPVFHCHGSCLMYKGFLVTSHLENELASSFHGWWRTQLGLWDGIKRNSLQEKWKPVSRLALWQQTSLPRMTRGPSLTSPSSGGPFPSTEQQELKGGPSPSNQFPQGRESGSFMKGGNILPISVTQDHSDEGEQEEDNNDGGVAVVGGSLFPLPTERPFPIGTSTKVVRSFSALVGIGHFTLGFVLEHLTDYQGHVGPDVGWLRRAMATIGRLYQSGLSRSFECWLEKEGEREEFIELSGTSSSAPSKHHAGSGQQEKLSTSGPNSMSTIKNAPPSSSLIKKVPVTGSILKNAGADSQPCPVHFSSGGVGSFPSSSMTPICTCSQGPVSSLSASHSSSPYGGPLGMKNFLGGTPPSSTSSSSSLSSQSLIGSGGIRSGIIAATTGSLDDVPYPGSGDNPPVDSDDGGEDLDDTTTGTGSDNSSFKWYESTTSGDLLASGGRSTTGSDVKFIRVTRGNVLFDYIQVEFGRGVMLSTKDVHEGWAAVVRHNFRQSATVIHHILHKAANARNRLEERGYDKKWVSRALAPISEHGILFNCQVTEPRDLHKKKPRKREVNYWVVGRIYPEEREIYICYEDGPMSQNLIEVAYKIALNVYC